VVASSGTLEEPPLAGGPDAAGGAPRVGSAPPARSLLLSKLKPLLQIHWHADFDETNMAFLNEDGSVGRVKKMKHLVVAVLRWREQRVQRRQRARGGGKPSSVDLALAPRLELVASTAHNDMLLRCLPPDSSADEAEACANEAAERPLAAEVWGGAAELAASPQSPEDVAHELALLRAENAELRCMNRELMREHSEAPKIAVPQLMAEIFDDPFEPPPQKEQFWGLTSTCSTPVTVSSTLCSSTFDMTSSRTSATPSEAVSPTGLAAGGLDLGEKICALVPVWFDHRCVIPTGIVDRFRSHFESTACPDAASFEPAIPSGIVERFRSQFESTAGPGGAGPPLLPPMYFKP
jgi:hypothetical protein